MSKHLNKKMYEGVWQNTFIELSYGQCDVVLICSVSKFIVQLKGVKGKGVGKERVVEVESGVER